MHDSEQEQCILDLERELRRLEEQRKEAVRKRDKATVVVENGDDTGFALSLALDNLRQIDDRIEQIRGLITSKRHNMATQE